MSFFGLGSNNESNRTTTTKRTGAKFNVEDPYSTVKTTSKGVNAEFKSGSAFDTINDFVNSNIGNLLNEYLNPSLNSTTNKALLKNYTKTLNSIANNNFENNVINPLSNRNMIRSSQATNMYNSFNNNLSDNISNYIDSLLSQSQQNSANVLSNLLNSYLMGTNALYKDQTLSLQGSLGNGTTKTTGNAGVSSSSSNDLMKLGMQILPLLLMN